MIAVIFEVEPVTGGAQRYFAIAQDLRPHLAHIDGFISVERFESLNQPGRFLSLSFWRDEAAVHAWRNHGLHRQGQAEGRDTVFANYRIRVAQVVRDYGLRERDEAPPDARQAHG
ncbi:MAG: antibiotic biosynthesis monooxygenase [Hydrogenophaga sp.]|uniref:antibiotic biosynthesis monooxygenase family protein n=1 Tax=Hydrogenophaga sp. TaxID=1904254 RepID=UPI001D91A373|nr:antibiotic biosynthesis monooxygenase [Hydrogenophaga sp.]MBX3609615.1 antibiotic biosynthesis monooxygenase [Hydrogenophaga sp.]